MVHLKKAYSELNSFFIGIVTNRWRHITLRKRKPIALKVFSYFTELLQSTVNDFKGSTFSFNSHPLRLCGTNLRQSHQLHLEWLRLKIACLKAIRNCLK